MEMSGYLLLAGKAICAVPITALPETLVMSFSSSDMVGGDVGREVTARGERLCTCFPFADVRA